MNFKRHHLLFPFAILLCLGCQTKVDPSENIPKSDVVPSDKLVTYQKMELIGFIHFTVNTFTDKEWGYGDENPDIFNPTELNTDQWAKTAKEAGMKQLILTAKHHDGFCLWPSKYTEHSIKNSPYKNGQADLVREFVDSCRKFGLKVGLYLSPWDRNHPDYGREAYIDYYKNQLTELLTNYGEINEIWFDGANGGDGYYGGANEIRTIDSRTYYNWDSMFSLVKELQPEIKIFSDAGPDVRWIGNEHGHAGFTCWSTIDSEQLIIGKSDPDYLNTGDPNGKDWLVGQCDVSIRPGWFYHKAQDSLVKTPQELVDIYYKSVGRNGILLLNLPPDTRGLIHENDTKSLIGFKAIIDESFSKNLALNATINASNIRDDSSTFSPNNMVDETDDTYWAADDDTITSKLEIILPAMTEFDRILIQEPIKFGQRIKKFEVEVMIDGYWKKVFEGTTIGYKRLLRIEPVRTTRLKINILDAMNSPAISNVELFKASTRERAIK